MLTSPQPDDRPAPPSNRGSRRAMLSSALLILAVILQCAAIASAVIPVWGEPKLPLAWLPIVTASFLLGINVAWRLWGWWGGLSLSVVAGLMILWVAGATQDAAWLPDVLWLGLVSSVMHQQQRRFHREVRDAGDEAEGLQETRNTLEASLQAAQKESEGLQHRFTRYQMLQALGEQLAGLLQLQAVGDLIVERCFTLVGASDSCLLYLVDATHQEVALYCSKRATDIPSIQAKRGDQYDHWALRNRRPLIVDDAGRDYRFAPEAAVRPFRSLIICPMQVSQRVIGLVRLESQLVAAYTQDDLRFLSVLLDLASAAVDNATLYAQMQRLAMIDSLTGLRLKRCFMETLSQELARAARHQRGVGLLMIDIDHFKAYNDRLGHTAGDLVLKGVAKILHEIIPEDSLVARYGGEEFAVLLVDDLSGDPRAVAEAIRRRVAEEAFVIRQEPTRITISVGVAIAPADGVEPVDLLRASDERLYAAKRAGRNRVCTAV
ncbi:MAG: diguanylate cyclase [Candidatus Omnitrophica bacterium]|nr:diguanylate cyclase [Candidatus Omnitrophota bacterium]